MTLFSVFLLLELDVNFNFIFSGNDRPLGGIGPVVGQVSGNSPISLIPRDMHRAGKVQSLFSGMMVSSNYGPYVELRARCFGADR
jgi:hypothetical protein